MDCFSVLLITNGHSHILQCLPKSAEARTRQTSSSCFTDQVDNRSHASFAVARSSGVTENDHARTANREMPPVSTRVLTQSLLLAYRLLLLPPATA